MRFHIDEFPSNRWVYHGSMDLIKDSKSFCFESSSSIVLTFNWEAYVIIKLKQLLANSKINASKKFLKKKKWKERPNLKTKKFFTRINHLKKIHFFSNTIRILYNPHFKDILSLLFLFWTNATVWLTNCDKLWMFIMKTGF